MHVIDTRDIHELNIILDNAFVAVTKLREQWETIKWHYYDKDNMEFAAKVTHFQKDEIDKLFVLLLGESTT